MKLMRKLLTIALICTILAISIGIVSAQSSSDASASVIWVDQPVKAGNTTSVIITVTNNRSSPLVITRIGLHFDWMDQNQFYTSDLSGNPVTIPANSAQPLNALAIQVPPYVTGGSHNYYVAIDGDQGFAWDSETKTVTITSIGGSSSAPTSNPTNGGTGGQGEGIPLNILAIVAAVVIVVVALVVVLMLTRRKKRKAETPQVTSEPTTSKPEEKKQESSEEKADSEYSI